MSGALVIPAWMFASLVTVALALMGVLWSVARAWLRAEHRIEQFAETLEDHGDKLDRHSGRIVDTEKQLARIGAYLEISGVYGVPQIISKGDDQ